MKRALPLLIFLFTCAVGLYAQDASQDSGRQGFGLQASIFNNARTTSTDLNRNFSDASIYNLTPGDIFTLTLSSGIGLNATSGNRAASYSIQLQDDFTLDIPVLGLIDATDRRIPDLQREISSKLKKMLNLQHVSFTLSAPAQYNVFIYGNVQRPGFVVVSPMNRLIDAIRTAGGFKQNGTYRNIQLQRDDETIALDISKFYNHADFVSNPYLRPGDKIFVPEADIVAAITGQIQFPGLYELVEGETLYTLTSLAGGLLPGSQSEAIEVRRTGIDGVAERFTVSMADADDFAISSGDNILVRSIAENVERIAIEGAIYGKRLVGDGAVAVPSSSYRLDFPFYPGITLLDVLDGAGGPTPRAVADEAFIRRASTGETRKVDVGELWATRDELLNTAVFPGDYIFIPLQRSEIFISGSVGSPGAVAYVPGYSVSDYIVLAGGFDENRADTGEIFFLDEDGEKTPVTLSGTPSPGSHIYVAKKWLFSADQTVQNVLITTAWVTSVVTVVTTVLQFVFTYLVTP